MDYIEKALKKYPALNKDMVNNLVKTLEVTDSESVENCYKWHNEEELEENDVVFELVYRVRKKV